MAARGMLRAPRDAPAVAAMRRLAAQYPRYGYRRIRIFLKREGYVMSTDRTHPLWRQAGLQVPRRRPRRRIAGSRPRPLPPMTIVTVSLGELERLSRRGVRAAT